MYKNNYVFFLKNTIFKILLLNYPTLDNCPTFCSSRLQIRVVFCVFGTETISTLINVHRVLDNTSKVMWAGPGGPCPSIRVQPWEF